MEGLLGLSLPIFLKAVRVQYDYCIVLRLGTIKPTYCFIKPIYFFRARYAYDTTCPYRGY